MFDECIEYFLNIHRDEIKDLQEFLPIGILDILLVYYIVLPLTLFIVLG
jgi:hypothetical protein